MKAEEAKRLGCPSGKPRTNLDRARSVDRISVFPRPLIPWFQIGPVNRAFAAHYLGTTVCELIESGVPMVWIQTSSTRRLSFIPKSSPPEEYSSFFRICLDHRWRSTRLLRPHCDVPPPYTRTIRPTGPPGARSYVGWLQSSSLGTGHRSLLLKV